MNNSILDYILDVIIWRILVAVTGIGILATVIALIIIWL